MTRSLRRRSAGLGLSTLTFILEYAERPLYLTRMLKDGSVRGRSALSLKAAQHAIETSAGQVEQTPRSLLAEAGLEAGFYLRPFGVHDAVIDGVTDASTFRDHVISKGAFFAGADALDGGARAFVQGIGF